MEYEEMTKEEMQRFLIMEAEDGKTELQALRNLAKLIGIEFPVSTEEN